MNTPNNNPYESTDQGQKSRPDLSKGSALAGFGIGWAIMAGGGLLTSIGITVLQEFMSYNSELAQALIMILLTLPLVILIAAMVWFGKKGKSKIVKGIAAAFGSLVALILLLVAACFGMFAMNGSRF
jgi:glucan phosphoethanolaminetransferase (alkaline phosphatase superfamily)